jgi:S-DNA-T family DNA segregation ATPase FtsK/SpoIIIE
LSHRQGDYIFTPQTVQTVDHGGSLTVTLELPVGITPSHIEAKTEALAGAFGGSSATVTRDPYAADRVSLEVIGANDPLYSPSEIEGLSYFSYPRNADDLVPIGRYATGEPCEIDLREKSILIAGSPGSGKSVAMQQIVAAAAMSHDTALWILDPKGGVEHHQWARIAERFDDCTDEWGEDGAPIPLSGLQRVSGLLLDLQREMADRYAYMKASGIRSLPASPENPRILLVVDELATLTLCGDRKLRAALTEQLRDLVARGRACGMVFCMASQIVKAEIIPTELRANIALRMCFRIGESLQSDIALGDGQAKAGADASTIPTDAQGLGYLMGEGQRLAKRFRTHYLSDSDLIQIAEWAEYIRGVPPVEPVEYVQEEEEITDEAIHQAMDEWQAESEADDPAVVLTGCPAHLGSRGADVVRASEGCPACQAVRSLIPDDQEQDQ